MKRVIGRALVSSPILTFTVLVQLCCSAFAAQITAPGLHAAAVQADDKVSAYWPEDPVKCDLVLEGDIAEGDTATLKREFEKILGSWNAFSFFLCLRSPGGSLPEALNIAQFILDTQRPSIATVVEDGATCASACAFVFLAGSAPARVGAWPLRFLHPRGRLLFHSSRLNLAGYSDDELLNLLAEQARGGRSVKDTISDLYRDGLRDVQSVISTFQRFSYERERLSDPWVRPSLFLEIFSQDPNEWICVDTVDAVGRWNVQVFGFQPPKNFRNEQFLNICRNAYKWRSDSFAKDEMDDFGENDPTKLRIETQTTSAKARRSGAVDFNVSHTLPYQALLAPLKCVIQIKYGQSEAFDAEAVLDVSFKGGGGTVTKLTPVSLFKSDTLLPSLPGVRQAKPGPVAPAAKRAFSSAPGTVMNGCTFKSIPKLDEDACQARCSDDAGCVAYSHNKLHSICELKHTLTALQMDPTWTSGVPSTNPASSRSSRSIRMSQINVGNRKRLDGGIVGELKIDDYRGALMCADNCKSENACVAMEYDGVTQLCRRFSSITGLKATPEDYSVETLLKTQR